MRCAGFAALLLAAVALPAAEYSTYIGDQNTWDIRKLVIDASGNTYVAGGRTFNLSFDPLKPTLVTEAVIAKLDTNGKTVLFANLSGKGNDVANAVAVDAAGNIYLAGSTTSPNFPVKNALDPNPPSGVGFLGATKGFFAKLSPIGEILYSTYMPAPIQAIAVDSTGAVYVTGTQYSGGVPIISSAFLTKIDAFGAKIVYSKAISGSNKPCGAGSSCFTSGRGATGVAVAVDGAGNAYFAGNSDVTDLPTTTGVLFPTGAGGWVAKLDAAGTTAWLTYLDTRGETLPPFFTPATFVRALAVDAAGNAFVAGSTKEGAFARKLNPTGTAVLWDRHFGDEATSAALDSSGNFWVAGQAKFNDVPNPDGWSTGQDFVARLDGGGATTYSARYPTGTVRQSIAADSLLHTTTPTGVVSAVASNAHPAVRPWTVGPTGGQVAAGMVVEIYGPHIGGAGASVYFNDIPAPILYSGDPQINVAVPFELDGLKTARVRIGTGPEFTVAVLPAMPRIAVAVNQDGTVNSQDNPASAGSVMTMWVTGAALPNPIPGNGQVATGAQEYFVGTLTADGALVKILYAGAAPGLVAGVAQINFVAPDHSSNLVLSARNYGSPPYFIYVR
jgi:uncharacterized protein (TIGR03437 family)